MFLNFDKSKTGRDEYQKKMTILLKGIANNYPEALPDLARSYPLNRVGSIITPKAVAFELPTPPPVTNAIEVMGAKLAHALYFRETGKVLTLEYKFFTAAYQPQRGEFINLTSYLTSLLPSLTVGTRNNIKEYGDRFRYIFGYKEQEDFFLYAAQFGHGIILLGIICGPGVEMPIIGPPLGSASNWRSGAYGAGANAVGRN